MNLYCIVFGLVFLAAGSAFFAGLAPDWLRAWCALPKKEKRTVQTDRLSKNIGCVLGAASAVFLASGLSQAFLGAAFTWCMLGWFVLTGLDAAYIAYSRRYKSE